jgi:uncharacterized membrane protein YfcA
VSRVPAPTLAVALAGTAAGLLAGLFGIEGGAVLTPLLVILLGVDQHRAQGISLAALLPPVGLPAVLEYRRRGVRIDWRWVATLDVGFMLGGAGGAHLAHRLPERALRWTFAGFLVISALSASSKSRTPDPRRSMVSPSRGLAIGALAGAFGGLLGIGGGIVALPLLQWSGGMSQLEAAATTLAMMLPPIGLSAVVVYAHDEGGLPWMLLVVVAACFATGAALGARVATRIERRTLGWVFAAFALAAAAALLRVR